MDSTSPIPATILTGFLGAGKTTLLNSILRQERTYKFGIILNEMAEIGIDDQLIETRSEEIMLMKNGCICCTVRKDLVQSIQQLLRRGGFDYLLIETTGIANPQPIAQTFFNVSALSSFVRLDSIVTVVDAEQIDEQVRQERVAIDQIVMGDFILLNKTDLASESRLAQIEDNIRKINPHAVVYRSQHAAIDLHNLLDRNAFNVEVGFTYDPVTPEAASHAHHHEDIASISLRVNGMFDGFRFEAFLKDLALRHRVYRSKGIVAIAGSRRRAVFHGVNNRFTIYMDRNWGKSEARESKLVFIGKGLSHVAIDTALRQCLL